ncbi:MAG: peptide chain release factor N(5)-glutamine methyltransferase [Magnetococcus sp. WYHC-3]
MNSPQRWTVRSLLAWANPWLRERGIVDSPRLDAELLLAHALGVARLALFLDPDRPLVADELAAFKERIRRRAQREPVAYIVGRKAFYKAEFVVSPDVLIPRPETECLVEAALRHLHQRDAARVLDLCTGSGAVLLSLLGDRPADSGVGSDLSEAALAIARDNARRLGLSQRVTWVQGDLFAALAPAENGSGSWSFDLILSNPPYVADAEMAQLAVEIRDHEPELALRGGRDGMDLYRRLVPEAVPYLAPGGALMVEIGAQQGRGVADLFTRAGLAPVAVLKDYAGLDRVVTGRVVAL